ncbi:MAG: hypothetical protein FWG72_02420 [Oscillospiraceae bacterium]|nr:hypothetical protein [Oscillospiraceae bacterium]
MIRNRRGASMLFVLAAMLLLMAIGVSALTAAGANLGAAASARAENQLNLYVNSMELTLRELINQDEFKAQLFWMAYNDDDGHAINMELDEEYGWDGVTFQITVSGELRGHTSRPCSPYVVAVEPTKELDEESGEEIITHPGSPSKAHISQREYYSGGELWVTVEAEYRGLTVVSVTTYHLVGGAELLEADDNHTDPLGFDEMVYELAFGTWTFRRHERVSF